ncbi:hypothetical protein V3C99_007969, partial [Haemonchus contortus]
MSARIPSYKRQLTLFTNKLGSLLQRYQEEKVELPRVADDRSPIDYPGHHRQVEEALGAIQTCVNHIESILSNYATTLDSLQEPAQKEFEVYDEYAAKADERLSEALDYLVLLEARSRALRSFTDNHPVQTTVAAPSPSQNQWDNGPRIRKMELPTLPVPTFRGNIWEWDNFWSLFDANIHSQTLPELYKFNYLLNALKGEALSTIKKFQVSPENYSKAVEFLKSKYGNSEELVNRLIDRIDRMQLKSLSLRDQRVFFEEIQVIVSQLKQKGENVDSQWLLKQVLSKFPLATQRRVLEKKHALPHETRFEMDILIKFLEDAISSEETISLFTGQSQENRNHPQHVERKENPHANGCMYCRGAHKSAVCATYKTPQERSRFLREHNLCMICASPKHAAPQCKKRSCFICQGAHHTSCCFKNVTEQRTPAQTQGPQNSQQRMTRAQTSSNASRNTHRPTSNVNQVYKHEDMEHISWIRGHQTPEIIDESPKSTVDTAICELHSAQKGRKPDSTFLPTGELTIFDPSSKSLKKVAVLLDTGAELSFIDDSLAEELGLRTIEETKLRLHTFGSNEIQEVPSRRVQLNTWDEDGQPLSLTLYTHKILTKELTAPPILKEDLDYIKSRNINIQVGENYGQVKPLILLGCDQVWSLIKEGKYHVQLPSGLHLVQTRLGQLVTGKLGTSRPNTHTSQLLALSKKWEECWSLDASIGVVSRDSEPTEEEELWTKYWELDRAGTEKFSESEEKVQQMLDQQVWNRFKETVEIREDGYYVRLPWKEGCSSLPDNRAIAYRRLVSTWSSLKDKGLLDQYNEVFQDQLRQNIIEVVNEEERAPGRVHYIPHQAVLTPHKNTTKLRIVFDASARYKNASSLNDNLYRGPVILPSLHGLLLRFRFGRIAMIADVEKAFLQVHLQEIDRDATRFFWLRNHNESPSQENIQTYRFTRVTFGLLSSPFLLAATICFHLDQYQGNEELVEAVKENLYVDNLLLSSDTLDEAMKQYSRTKQIFNELHMNLREYVSNNQELMAKIADRDKSLDTSPKVLGIVWDSREDNLHITCSIPIQAKTTKRTVASTIASIYDPMGWMLPLVHKAKIFLQSLWKTTRDWDTPLTEEECEKWKRLCDGINGFHKKIARFLTTKRSRVNLISFADASSEAMATCVYLRTENLTHLLMAKAKLPSVNSKITIPKLELNAMTLAMRLTYWIINQLQSVVTINRVLVLSDSEIVLNWIKSRVRHDAGPFIKNRVNEIQEIASKIKGSRCPIQLGHISSQSNPADCATRGLDKHELVDHFWWMGPEFIRVPEANWDDLFKAIVIETTFDDEKDELVPKICSLAVDTTMNPSDIDPKFFQSIRVQTLPNVKRTVAYVMRFIRVLARRMRSKQKAHTDSFMKLSAL